MPFFDHYLNSIASAANVVRVTLGSFVRMAWGRSGWVRVVWVRVAWDRVMWVRAGGYITTHTPMSVSAAAANRCTLPGRAEPGACCQTSRC